MGRRLSICQPTLCGDNVAEDAAIAQAAGIDTIALFCGSLNGEDLSEVRSILGDRGVTVSTYVFFGAAVDHVDDQAAFEEGKARIIEASLVGASGLLVVSGPLGKRSVAEADALCRRWFTTMAPFAEAHGIRLLFEPLHPVRRSFTYVHRLGHAASIIDGIANASLVVDTGHLWWDVTLLSDFRAHLGSVGLVQFTNVDPVALAEGRLDRTGLEGDVPLGDLLRQFDAAGYTGVYEFEGRTSLRGDERVSYATDVREWFNAVWRASPKPP